jgi:GNAT superfamily N-acetyltransferase
MLHRRAPDRPADVPVEEFPFAEARPVIVETYRRMPELGPETVVAFADQHGKYERVLGTRFFVGLIEDEPAGVCELWMDGTDALVEHVDTLEEFRGRGVARAVVLRAIEEAKAAGAQRVYIVADDDDWPKELYARLGFDALGRGWEFIRFPTASASPQESG